MRRAILIYALAAKIARSRGSSNENEAQRSAAKRAE
jgi:hypothetical protein